MSNVSNVVKSDLAGEYLLNDFQIQVAKAIRNYRELTTNPTAQRKVSEKGSPPRTKRKKYPGGRLWSSYMFRTRVIIMSEDISTNMINRAYAEGRRAYEESKRRGYHTYIVTNQELALAWITTPGQKQITCGASVGRNERLCRVIWHL